MKKMLPIIVVVLIIGAIGGYFLVQRENLPVDQIVDSEGSQDIDWSDQEGVQEDIGVEDDAEDIYTGTLKYMVGLGIPLRCDLQTADYSGTTWVKGESFYTEVDSDGQTGKIIFKDDCLWNWSEGESQGVKMCFDPEEAEEIISGQTDSPETTDLPTGVEYNCRPAAITDAKFNPPSNVEFMDMDELMQGMPEIDM